MLVKVTSDRARIMRKISGGARMANAAVAELALADSNEFVKVDQGMLRDSGRVDNLSDRSEVSWNTPYAKRQYYTGTPRKDENPNASLQWVEVAKRRYGKDWNKAAKKAFEEGFK